VSEQKTRSDDEVTAEPGAGENAGTSPDNEGEAPGPAPDGAEAGATEADDAELVVEDLELDLLGAALRQRDEYLDALRHLQADFENYKKRALKQQAESWSLAAQALVDKLLPALDTADLAVAHTEGEEIRQVRSAFIEALEREGLERIADAGGPFDPNRHDAVAHEPGDGADQEVAEVLRAGYAWKGRVLRPAMVKVRG
jgi:molecular chaperone GrpE